jgi:PKD domain-containing protein
MQKVFAMLTEAPPAAPTSSERASFFDELRDEFAIVQREAASSTPLVRRLVLLSLVLVVVALAASIIAHGRLPQVVEAAGPLGVSVVTPDGKAALPVTAPVKLTAQPDNVAKNEKVSYTWTFGDGATGSGADVEHTYASYGYYEVVVTARDAQGQQARATVTLNVLPPAPQAVIKATQDRAYSYMLSADGTGSKGAGLHYFWDFGDGHVSDSGDDRQASHLYLAAGTYTLTLTVVDVAGQQSVATKQITVKKL